MKRLVPFALAACVMWAAQGPNEQPRGRIAGTVRSVTTGEPLKSAVIALHLSSRPQGFSRTTTTGSEGDFVFLHLPPGQYNLSIQKTGYRTLRGSASGLTLRENQQVNYPVFKLWPQGAISGRVLDSEGEAVPEARVRAYALRYRETGVKLSFAGRAQSDDLGEYRIYGLQAGKYLLRVWPPRERHTRQRILCRHGWYVLSRRCWSIAGPPLGRSIGAGNSATSIWSFQKGLLTLWSVQCGTRQRAGRAFVASSAPWESTGAFFSVSSTQLAFLPKAFSCCTVSVRAITGSLLESRTK